MHCHTSKKNCTDWVPPKYHYAQPTEKTVYFDRKRKLYPCTRFHYIDASLEEQLKTITGVIESGLFINYDIEVVVTR